MGSHPLLTSVRHVSAGCVVAYRPIVLFWRLDDFISWLLLRFRFCARRFRIIRLEIEVDYGPASLSPLLTSVRGSPFAIQTKSSLQLLPAWHVRHFYF